MTQTSGIVLGVLLIPVLFLLFWSGGYLSLTAPLQETTRPGADAHPGTIRVIAPVAVAQASAVGKLRSVSVDDETSIGNDARQAFRYLVWSPFKSEWAAQGFAQRLILATGVPVNVVSEGPGDYQVVFSYRDDAERQAMVEQIETVIGLELE